ncbi:MAG: transposase zinc-binding domain-containing protein, partial [Candidatus Rokuibacteriota bacterium]
MAREGSRFGVTTNVDGVRSFPRLPPALWRIHCLALWALAGRAYVAAMARSVGDYRLRDAEHAVLYRVIDEHLDAFLETTRRHADGVPLPAFVEQEFRDFLTCGVLAHGFARLRCTDCALARLVPFSCKGRGFCPNCGGRRMTECAARLVDGVLPRVPVRQWVLSLPYRLRYLLAWDHGLARAVLGVSVRVLLGFQRHRARRHGVC